MIDAKTLNAAKKAQAKWDARCEEAWDAAEAEMFADGWRITGKNTRLPIFKKFGEPDMVLVRDLGAINWRARIY